MPEIDADKVSKKARSLFDKGFASMERGKLDYAIDMLLACVELEPGYRQARKFLRSAELKLASQKKKSLLSGVSMTGGLSVIAKLKAGKIMPALLDAEKLLRKDPVNKRHVEVFVEAAIAADLPLSAIDTLQLSLAIMPDDIKMLNTLGNLCSKTGDTAQAKVCFEKVVELSPRDPAALKALKDSMARDSMSNDGWQEASDEGGSYRDLINDTEEATKLEQTAKAVKTDSDADNLIQDTLKKIEAEPENINFYRALGKLYAQKKMFDEAAGIVLKALEISPGDPELDKTLSAVRVQGYDHQILELTEAGDAEAVLQMEYEKVQFEFADLQERVVRYPNDLELKYDWGVMLFNNDYINEAIGQFQLSQRNPKTRALSLYYLAMCFKSKEQYDMAVEQLDKAASEMTMMTEEKKDILYELGGIAMTMGDNAKAAGYYKEIYQVDISYKDIAAKVEQAYGS